MNHGEAFVRSARCTLYVCSPSLIETVIVLSSLSELLKLARVHDRERRAVYLSSSSSSREAMPGFC